MKKFPNTAVKNLYSRIRRTATRKSYELKISLYVQRLTQQKLFDRLKTNIGAVIHIIPVDIIGQNIGFALGFLDSIT